MIVNRFFCMASLSAVLLITGSIGVHSSSDENSKKLPKGMKASDPRLTGQRDMNYDHMIIPGDRIGPVRLGGRVSDAVQHLGNPDRVTHFTSQGEVNYTYFSEGECISFTWSDEGIEPEIEKGWRGIAVTCDKWSTPSGLHVGSSMKEVNAVIGQYCPTHRKDGSLLVASKSGIWFDAKDRNSPVSIIRVMPVMDNWGGMCTD